MQLTDENHGIFRSRNCPISRKLIVNHGINRIALEITALSGYYRNYPSIWYFSRNYPSIRYKSRNRPRFNLYRNHSWITTCCYFRKNEFPLVYMVILNDFLFENQHIIYILIRKFILKLLVKTVFKLVILFKSNLLKKKLFEIVKLWAIAYFKEQINKVFFWDIKIFYFISI